MFLFILLGCFFLANPHTLFADGGTRYKIKKVVIDAGHGGKDPGALQKKTYEKNITLAIALKLGEYITEYMNDVEVIYTRKTDVFIPLDKRAEIANSANADLFISIHVNANNNTLIQGTESYVMGTNKADDNLGVALRENSVIVHEDDYSARYQGYDPKSTESHIAFSLMQNAYLDQSLIFAKLIQDQFRGRARRYDRGVKQDAFLVLWNTTMPSVLIETGYITHKTEKRYLSSTYGQEIIASAIFRAFREYKTIIDSKSNFVVPDEQLKHSSKATAKKQPTAQTNITFKVQVLASKVKVAPKAKAFNGIQNIEELKFNGSYHYLVGQETELDKALELQKEIRKKIPGAFVCAFKKGKKIPLQQAINELEN